MMELLAQAAGATDEATKLFGLTVGEWVLLLGALGTLRGKLTVLIIAERLSMAREADLIHLIEGGHRVESGSWKKLMIARGRFRVLAEAEGGAHGLSGEAPT